MIDNSTLQYTIMSTDENDYGTIKTCLEAPPSPYTRLSLTGLTTLCSMVLLGTDDYIEIDGTQYNIEEEHSDLNSISLTELLTGLLSDISIKVEIDNCNRLIFKKNYIEDFEITGASYNMKQICGMYSTEFPLESIEGYVYIKSVGFYQSTPILYLISNVGAQCYLNRDRTYYDQKIVMRIYNSFSPNLPIVCNNAEFSTVVSSNSLGNVYFKLVDANFVPIKLLSPIYLAASAERIEPPNGQIAESPSA